ncbi:hypothetical protein CPB83DRAFT_935012, partial [Crepidotus variabilis]
MNHSLKGSLVLLIAENDVVFSQADTPDDSLRLLLGELAGKDNERAYQMLAAHRQGHAISRNKTDCLFKDRELLQTFAEPYCFKGLCQEKLWKASTLKSWAPFAASLLTPYVTHQMGTLRYLASYDSYEKFDSTILEIQISTRPYSKDLQKRMEKMVARSMNIAENEINYSIQILDRDFFDILDKLYMEHLRTAITAYGLDPAHFDELNVHLQIPRERSEDEDGSDGNEEDENSNEDAMDEDDPKGKRKAGAKLPKILKKIQWERNFQSYMKDLQQKINIWVQDKIAASSSLHEDSTINILNQISKKMMFLVHANAYQAEDNLPVITQPPPFFTRLFLYDLGKDLVDAEQGAMLAFSICDPLIPYNFNHKKTKQIGEYFIIPKLSTLFEQWLMVRGVMEKSGPIVRT